MSVEDHATPAPNEQSDDARAPNANIAFDPTVLEHLPTPLPQRRNVPLDLTERYQNIEFVGEGGMGTVYRAVDPRLGRTIAIKLLKGDDPELWRRFLAEARAQARIEHEHVCRVYDAGQANGEPYIAMQYIEGEPLSRIASRLTLEQCVKIIGEVAKAVHEAHRLGMIHRDIKPGNVLLEVHDDGSHKPYIMDFGLVREVEDKGETRTGAVLGTPAFMPPEQAKGDVRAMDRRSDVYSLGATLYDALAGRPPFVAEHPWKLLMMVAYEEAPTLGSVKKGVPPELETIVMKCLERDPVRRYESARALAEDLQRFLDGEPIQAKRASWAYVAWTKVRKHKLAASAIGMAILAAVVVTTMFVRARRQAVEDTRLAQALGEDVKEMELFLRNAYGMPLHDVERERDVVREKLADIERRMVDAGGVGAGPRHYALGRGAFALGDPDGARLHLEKAIAAGASFPELEYALGRSFGELFRRALDETRRITNEAERKKKIEEIEVALRDPALVHLRAAVAAKIEVPAYAEGLIALYEGKNDDALAKAKEAFEKAPWMYEAKKLEADALYAMGSKYRHDAAFDYEKMKSYFDPAAKAYARAAEHARSDPDVHRAECELWEKMGYAAHAIGKLTTEMDAADRACTRAVESSSRDGSVRIQRAMAAYHRFSVASNTGTDIETAQKSAMDAANEAARVRPRDAMALYARAATLYVQTMVQASRGEPLAATAAIAAFEQVLDVEPRFTWALNELGQTYLIQAESNRLHGLDPRETLDRAAKQFQRAVEVDPTFTFPVYGMIRAHIYRLTYEIDHGLNADTTLWGLSQAIALLDKQSLSGWLPVYWKAKAARVRAAYESSKGADPRPLVTEGLRIIHAFTAPGTEEDFLLHEIAELHEVEADYAASHGLDTLAQLAPIRQALQKTLSNDMEYIDNPVLAARMDLSAIRMKEARDDVKASDFDAALAILRPLMSTERNDPRGYQTIADIHAQKAAWLDKHDKSPDADIAEGLRMIAKVLAIHPHNANAYATRGALLVLRARAGREEDRKEAAREARAAFAAAFRENPRLEKDYAVAVKELADVP